MSQGTMTEGKPSFLGIEIPPATEFVQVSLITEQVGAPSVAWEGLSTAREQDVIAGLALNVVFVERCRQLGMIHNKQITCRLRLTLFDPSKKKIDTLETGYKTIPLTKRGGGKSQLRMMMDFIQSQQKQAADRADKREEYYHKVIQDQNAQHAKAMEKIHSDSTALIKDTLGKVLDNQQAMALAQNKQLEERTDNLILASMSLGELRGKKTGTDESLDKIVVNTIAKTAIPAVVSHIFNPASTVPKKD